MINYRSNFILINFDSNFPTIFDGKNRSDVARVSNDTRVTPCCDSYFSTYNDYGDGATFDVLSSNNRCKFVHV